MGGIARRTPRAASLVPQLQVRGLGGWEAGVHTLPTLSALLWWDAAGIWRPQPCGFHDLEQVALCQLAFLTCN